MSTPSVTSSLVKKKKSVLRHELRSCLSVVKPMFSSLLNVEHHIVNIISKIKIRKQSTDIFPEPLMEL